jgi:hypothetical protein
VSYALFGYFLIRRLLCLFIARTLLQTFAERGWELQILARGEVGKLTSAGDNILLSDCAVDCSDDLGVGGVGALVDLRREGQ